jgi:hypothetical protein
VHPGSAQSISSAGWPTHGPFSLLLPLTTGSRTLGALLRCLAPAPSHCRPDPVSSRPTCQPRRPASPRPRCPPLSHGNASSARATAEPLPPEAAPLPHTTPRPPTLALPHFLHASVVLPQTPPPLPPRRPPFKREPHHRWSILLSPTP